MTDTSRLGLAGHDFFEPPAQLLACFVDQLRMHKLDYWPWNRGELEIDAYRDLLSRYEVDVYTVNVDTSCGRFGSAELAAAASQATRAALDDAVAFGAQYVQLYLDRADGDSHEEQLESLARPLAPLADEAHARGVMLAIENNFDPRDVDREQLNFSRSPSKLQELVERLGPERVAVTFDAVNFMMTGVDPVAAYRELATYVVNVHLKDCVPIEQPGGLSGRQVLCDGARRFARSVPVGEGATAWPALIAALDEADFQGWLTVDPYCDPEDVLAWTRQSLEHVRGPMLLTTDTERNDQR
jgi:sugar phosphate isomerase/epimerase